MQTTTRATTKQGNAVRRRIERRCRRLGERRASRYRRVILSLYMAADADGLYTNATNIELGSGAGVPASAVGDYLRMAEADGLVRVFRPGADCVSCRVVIFKEHRQARGMIRDHEAYTRSTETLGRRGR